MGFYSPATIVKDARRHGLRVRPIDVTRSRWDNSLEHQNGAIVERIGLRYVRGFEQIAAESPVHQRKRAPSAPMRRCIVGTRFGRFEKAGRRVPCGAGEA